MKTQAFRRVELSGEVTLQDLMVFVEQVGGVGQAPRTTTKVELLPGVLVVQWEVP